MYVGLCNMAHISVLCAGLDKSLTLVYVLARLTHICVCVFACVWYRHQFIQLAVSELAARHIAH